MEKVSIVVPCFNQAKYLSEALDSIIFQTYENWECIIINDGSPGNTEELALSYSKRDSRFIYIKKNNGGLSSARNAGLLAAKGKYILPLDADDKIGKEYLMSAVKVLEGNIAIKVVYAEAELFGAEQGKWNLPEFSLKRLALENMIYCSAFYRREDFLTYGGYDETMLNGWEDWDFWLRILVNGGDVIKLNDVHFYYRKKNSSMINDFLTNYSKQIDTRQKIYLKHTEFYKSLFGDPIYSFLQKEELRKEYDLRIKSIYLSKRYRIGNFILKPIKFFNWKK